MSYSEELLLDWVAYSLETAGEVLPINHIQIGAEEYDGDDYDENSIYIGYMVPGSMPSIMTKELGPVRKLLIYYPVDDIQGVYKH